MKRLVCVFLCLLLALSFGFASAEDVNAEIEAKLMEIMSSLETGMPYETERTRTISMQGEDEEITEAVYASPNGYEIWYDVNAFKLNDVEGEGYDEFVPVDPDALKPLSLTVVTAEVPADEADGLIDEVFADHTEGGYAMSEITEDKLDNGLPCKICEGIKDGVVARFYLIKGEKATYCVTATFPEDSYEGYGERLDIMVKTLVG